MSGFFIKKARQWRAFPYYINALWLLFAVSHEVQQEHE